MESKLPPCKEVKNFFDLKVPKNNQHIVLKKLIREIEDWVNASDIEADLDGYSRIPFLGKYNYQLLHLAALAVRGKWEPLSDYKDGLAKGDRINFVKEIDEETINKALSMAYDVAYG